MDDIRVLYISDDAWQRLHDLATEAGYKKRTTTKQSGFSDYVAFLLRKPFTDTRPDDVRVQDDDMIACGMAPEWQLHTPRRRRNVKVTTDTLVQASIEAYRLHIASGPDTTYAYQPTVFNSVGCLARILEAYGTGWLEHA